MNGKTLRWEVTDSVALITLNQPDLMNPMGTHETLELIEVVAALDADEQVRAIVVTGAGKCFSAGAPLHSGGDSFGADAIAEFERVFDERGLHDRGVGELWNTRTPTIAAVNGAAVGAGMSVAMLLDVRVVAEDAKLGFIFARRGMITDANMSWVLPRLVGGARAVDLLLTGRLFSGREAREMGLASYALPQEEVLPAALALAGRLASETAPGAVGLIKQMIYSNLEPVTFSTAYRGEVDALATVGRQPDAEEGVVAFLERRSPVWSGSKAALPKPGPAPSEAAPADRTHHTSAADGG